MLSAEQLADITGLADARFDPASHEKRDADRIGVIGRGLLCRLAAVGGAIEQTLPVRLRDISTTGVSLLSPRPLHAGQEFLLGMERARAIRQAKRIGEATPPLLWVRCALVHVEPTTGSHFTIGARFLSFAAAPRRDSLRPKAAAASPAPAPVAAPVSPLGPDALFAQCPFGLALVEANHRLRRVNEAFCQITGYSADELQRLTFDAITHPDDLALDAHLAGRLYAGELTHYEMEKRYLRKDGHPVRIRLTAYLLRDDRGRVGCAVAMIRPLPNTDAPAKPLGAADADGTQLPRSELDQLRRAVLE